MRKNIFIILMLAAGLFASAQTEYDAIRLSQIDINGTARYMSLGGAMGALGGDASSIKDNPAGLGIYRSSELSGTLNLAIGSYRPVEWLGVSKTQNANSKLSFNNVSYIMALPTDYSGGLIGSNLSFSYQKLFDYNMSFSLQGGASATSFTDYLATYSSPVDPIGGEISYDNVDMPWLTVLGSDGGLINRSGSGYVSVLHAGEQVIPAYFIRQKGSLSEFSLGWAGNFNNNLFLGINMNIRNLNYSMVSTLSENFTEGGDFELVNSFTQGGLGVNAKLGVIYLPNNNLRLGLAFHTPSVSSFSEKSMADLYSSLIPANKEYPAKTPISNQAFNLISPLQLHASAAYMFGKFAFISGEYNFINYKGLRFGANSESMQNFEDINLEMGNVLNNVHVFKLGAEYRLTPSFSVRGGYAMMTPATNKDYKYGKLFVRNSINTNTEYFDQKYNTNYVTFGLGYRDVNWFIDFAYALRAQKYEFKPYQDSTLSAAVMDSSIHNIFVTLGIRM